MLGIKDIDKLAGLARIEIPAAEKKTLCQEVDSILNYVGEIQKLSGEVLDKEAGVVRNVFREDKDPHLPGAFTEELLAEAPEKEEGYVRVKKIL